MKLPGTLVKQIGAMLMIVGAFSTGHAQESDANATEKEDSQNVLENIIVTAQKQSQSIQDVSAAVTAMSGDTLISTGATELADIQNPVPSIQLQKESASTETYTRGVGSTLDLPMIESPNTFNINGVYILREVASTSIFDINRIEVLLGPQGTLYGRSALGGAINLLTNRPENEFSCGILWQPDWNSASYFGCLGT